MNASQPPVPSSQPGQSGQSGQPGQHPPPVQHPQAAAPTPGEATARGSALLRAVEVMEALRAADGDAWSHQQTHASLARYLLEETYEVLEVIDDPQTHGPGALRDELGDLLFQILFHARIGQEAEPAWDVDDVARSFIAKMERRNPHIFGDRRDEALEDPEDVEQIIAQWHAVKAAERQARGAGDAPSSAVWFDGIPERLPALQTAAKVVHRARSDGRLEELLAAADDAAAAPDAQQWGSGAARALLELAVRAESEDVDPESALRTLLARTRSAALEPDGPAQRSASHSAPRSAPRDGARQTPGGGPSDGNVAGPDGRTA